MSAGQNFKFVEETLLPPADVEEFGVSGEAILSGAREARVHVPKHWTAEYVGFRLVEGFEILRRAQVGRVGPSSRSGFWPTVYYEPGDIAGWADEHRKQVEGAMARRQSRPDANELQRMDEVMSWSLRHLHDQPLYADAVTLWAFTTAWDIDPAGVLRWRREKAMPIAENLAALENQRRAGQRQAIIREVQDWAAQQAAKRKIAGMAPLRRADAMDALRTQARNRMERLFKTILPVKANPTLGMPGKVLAVKTLDAIKKDALAMLADRLTLARVLVR